MAFAAANEEGWALAQFPRDFTGWAIEVGAYDGVSTSNTLSLEHAGWKVLAIEPNPDQEWFLKENREWVWIGACSDHSGRETFHINLNNPGAYSALKPTLDHQEWHPDKNSAWKQVEVEVETLDRLLARFEFPQLDLLSIDTEGTELEVLKGIDLVRWHPKCLIVEAWDEQNPILEYLKPFGYQRVERRIVNDLYLRETP